MKATLLISSIFLLSLLSAFAAPPPQKDFIGIYEGASIRKSPTGQSLVIELVVTKRNEGYSLAGAMNDTNREEGMDHTSNTHWQWTGVGVLRDGSLRFTYASHGDDRCRGSLRHDAADLILTLDSIRYRIHLSKQ